MSTATRIIKNTGFLYAKMGITMFISLYITRLVLNALGASDFGIYNVVGGAIAMLGFLHTAMSSATQRFMSYYEGKGDKEKQKYIFNVSTVLHYIIALLLVVILIIAGLFFFNGFLNIPQDRIFAAKVIYASLILSTIFTVISTPYEAVLNAHENMFYYSIVGVAESILKLIVAIIIVYYVGDKLILYGILMVVIPFTSRLIMQLYCRRRYCECVISPKKYWDKKLLKEMTSFAGWSFFGAFVSIIANYGQGIVLNVFFGPLLNAAHGIATQINGQISVFSNNMMKALNPVIVKNEGAKSQELKHKTIFVGSKISFYLLAFFAIPIFIEMPYILKIWIRNIPEYTIVFCRLMLIISLIDQLFITLPSAISATGKIKNYQISVSTLLIIPFIASLILFYYDFPPYIMYLAFMIQRLIRTFGVVLFFSKKLVRFSRREYLKKVVIRSILVVFTASIIGGIIRYSLLEGFNRFLANSLSVMLVFVLSVFHIGLTKSERGQVFGLIRNVKQRFFNKRNEQIN